jgi:hypothetical protein
MKRAIVGAILVFVALPLSAQRGRQASSTDPPYWVGLSYGYVDGLSFTDRDTRGSWQFSYASQLRATVEKTLQRGATVGVAAGFTTANLVYLGDRLAVPNCATTCPASADITQYVAFVRSGGGTGIFPMWELEAGITRFSNFRERTTGEALPPRNVTNDFTFGFGPGIGYGISPITSVYAASQLDFVLHPQDESAPVHSAPRLFSLRAGFRVGF